LLDACSSSAALKRAGIDDFIFHDLRHPLVSHFVMRGRDLKALQENLGHTTLNMTMNYAHLTQGHKKEAINRLNGLTTKKLIVKKRSVFQKPKMLLSVKLLIILEPTCGIEPQTC
jgi:hypothetical protein